MPVSIFCPGDCTGASPQSRYSLWLAFNTFNTFNIHKLVTFSKSFLDRRYVNLRLPQFMSGFNGSSVAYDAILQMEKSGVQVANFIIRGV